MVTDKPYRILYVDDEPGLLEIGKAFLEQTGGMEVETSIEASEALNRLRQEHFDAVVSDYQMPVMDGIELLEAIRARGDGIPFIIFTGKGREDVVIKAFKSGADFYLQKGGNPRTQFAELVNMIRTSIEKKNSERKLQDSERKLRSIINGMDQGMVVIGMTGKVLSFNQKAQQIMGFTEPESMSDLKVFEFQAFRGLEEQDKESLRKGFQSSINSGSSSLQRFPVQRLDGQMGWAEGYSSFLDFDGQPAVLILFRDITNEREMERMCQLSNPATVPSWRRSWRWYAGSPRT